MAAVYGSLPGQNIGLRASAATHIPQNSGYTPHVDTTPTSVSCSNGGLLYQRFHGQSPPKLVIGLPGDIYLDTSPSSPSLYLRRTDRWELIQNTIPLGNSSIRHPTCNDFILTFRASQWPFWIRDTELKSPTSGITNSPSSPKTAPERAAETTPPKSKKRKNVVDDAQPRKVLKAHHSPSGKSSSDPQTELKRETPKPKPRVSAYPLPMLYRPRSHKYYWDIAEPLEDSGSPGDFFFLLSLDGRSPRAYVKNPHWTELPYHLDDLRTEPIWNCQKPEHALSITPGNTKLWRLIECPSPQTTVFTVSDWLMQLMGKAPVQPKGGMPKLPQTEDTKRPPFPEPPATKLTNATTITNLESLEKYQRLEAEVAKLSEALRQLRASKKSVKTSVSVGTEVDSPKPVLRVERSVQTALVKDALPKVSMGVGREIKYSSESTQTLLPSMVSTGVGLVVEYSSQNTQTSPSSTMSIGVGTDSVQQRTMSTQTDVPYPTRETDSLSCKTCYSQDKKRGEQLTFTKPNLLQSIPYKKSRLRNEITEPPGPSAVESCSREPSNPSGHHKELNHNLPRPGEDASPTRFQDQIEMQDIQVDGADLHSTAAFEALSPSLDSMSREGILETPDLLADRDIQIFFRHSKENGLRRCRFCMHVAKPPLITEFEPATTPEELRVHCQKAHKEFWTALGKMSERKVQEMHEKFEKLDSRQ